MTPISDWRHLPFREIWVVDTEFYPGSGLANGGVTGDTVTPLCLVALEMRSGRLVRLWQNEFGPFPPYRLDNEALIVGYMLAAEFGVHAALGWGEPACALDAYVEFRHYVNDGAVRAATAKRVSIGSTARCGISSRMKSISRAKMKCATGFAGPPFSAEEQRDILDYCEDDTRALARLLPHIVPTLRPPLSHAMFRAKFQWAIAQQERRGVPLDSAYTRIRNRWDGMRLDLVTELDRPFGCYEIVNGKPHWRKQLFANYARQRGMSWPTYEDGTLDERDETFREMAGKYPHIEPLRELRYSLSKLRLHDLAIGNDLRNRALLWAYGTNTACNAPGASQYIFGPANGQFLDHAATRARSGASGLQATRSSDRRAAVGGQCAAASLRKRRCLPGHRSATRLPTRQLERTGAQGGPHAVQDRRAGHSIWAGLSLVGCSHRDLSV